MNQPKQQERGRNSFLLLFNSLHPHFFPIFLAISLFGLYLSTIAPGLTWANDGSDGGDLIAAAATGGIAHPTGYPLYLLLARLFQLLPIGSLAFRTNLMSATVTALGAFFVYEIVSRSLPSFERIQFWPAGMIAGYAFGLAPLIWSQALITEVYALQSCLVLLIFYLYMQPMQTTLPAQMRQDRWRGLLLGLAMGNHLTTLLIIPVAMWSGSFRGTFRSWRLDIKSIRTQATWMGIGLLIYVLLPLWALMHPAINWGNPITLGRLWWLVSGQLYQSYYLQASLFEIWEHFQVWAALLLTQFGWLGLVLGLIGLFVFGAPSRLYLLTSWTAAISMAFAMFYGSIDFYIYLIPMFICFAIWIGLGLAGLFRKIPQRFSKLGLNLGALILIGYFAGRSITQMNQVDASHDLRAESFGREVLVTVPQDAIIFAKGDQAVFALWYFHFALHERPDLLVLSTDLLHFDWYQENLHVTYPTLIVPGPFPWPETIVHANPLRSICYVQYTDHTEVDCSKPLNSP